jgi:hypothetical protein
LGGCRYEGAACCGCGCMTTLKVITLKVTTTLKVMIALKVTTLKMITLKVMTPKVTTTLKMTTLIEDIKQTLRVDCGKDEVGVCE